MELSVEEADDVGGRRIDDVVVVDRRSMSSRKLNRCWCHVARFPASRLTSRAASPWSYAISAHDIHQLGIDLDVPVLEKASRSKP